ncbi:MAG: DEAD/DEAH box helicase [Candidatus Bathyarchaeota archaeon]
MATLKIKSSCFVVSFDYSPVLVELVKVIPGRKYEPESHTWTVPINRDNYTKLRSAFLTLEHDDAASKWVKDNITSHKEEDLLKVDVLKKYKYKPKDYEFKTKPYDHQITCFNYITASQDDSTYKPPANVGLFLEMGLGKTKIIADAMAYLNKKKLVKSMLYICPNSITEVIKREFALHSPIEFKAEIVSGSRTSKEQIILDKKNDIVIINYEAVDSLIEVLLERGFDAIICDESTRIKNPNAQCSKAVHTLGRAVKFRYIMTGTPITQNAIDIYSQYKFLDPNIFGSSYYAFRNTYAVMGGFQAKQIVSYQNLDHLQKKIYSCSLRFTKEQCLDLPDKVYEKKYITLNKEEDDLYQEIKDNILIEIGKSKISATIILTKLIKLSQVTSGFLKTDSGSIIRMKSSSKMKELEDTLDDIMPSKTVIWCNFVDNIAQISEMCNSLKLQFVKIDGSVPANERQKAVDTFQNDPECKVFIGQIQTAGLGITLTAAKYEIFYTNTYSLANRLQAEDRVHRIGLKHNVTIIDIIARKTIDESIIKILSSKQNFADIVIDNIREIIDGNY